MSIMIVHLTSHIHSYAHSHSTACTGDAFVRQEAGTGRLTDWQHDMRLAKSSNMNDNSTFLAKYISTLGAPHAITIE